MLELACTLRRTGRPGAGIIGRVARLAIRLALTLVLASPSLASVAGCRRAETFAPLSSDGFWALTTTLSEPPGVFAHSENLVSNESRYAHTIGGLRPMGGVYIGVGPEQNFSYIARLEPELAFIVDIRRENRALHLWYKALFEISADRVEFLSRLLARERPATADPADSVDALVTAFDATASSARMRAETDRLVRERLLTHHGFPLDAQDVAWIDYAATAFMADGLGIHYARSRQGSPPGPAYRRLMTVRDLRGQGRSYLASETAFAIVKALHARNLIVPIVGDFSGPTALRQVGAFVRAHGMTVSAFYGSNVEVYLTRQQHAVFCGHLAALPIAARASFIGGRGARPLQAKIDTCATGAR